MRLEQLQYLIHIAEVGSIAKSAPDLYISQQGLSQAVQQLERELGVQVFERVRNRIILTEAGEKTIEKAKEILQTYNELVNILKSYTAKDQSETLLDKLYIYSIPIICLTILPGALNLLQKKFPYISIKVNERPATEIINSLITSDNRIGLFSLPEFELQKPEVTDSRAVVKELYRCKLMACVSKSSDLAQKKSLSFADFIKHPLSMYHAEINILDYLYDDKVVPNIMLHTTNLYLCRETIASGAAIGFTNNTVEIFFKNPNILAIPFEKDIEMVFGYVIPPGISENSPVIEFIKLLKRTMKIAIKSGL